MNKIYICFFFAIVLCISTASIEDEFELWMKKYNKVYDSLEEKMYRMKVFEENVAHVSQMNSASNQIKYGINAFSDMTSEEFSNFYTTNTKKFSSVMKSLKASKVVAPSGKNRYLPKYFSWLDEGAVSSVKNQKKCGSCFAFGSVANMEGQLFLHTGRLVNLSEQQIMDCDHECTSSFFPICDDACGGGTEENAFQYVIKSGGIMRMEDYPYTAVKGDCQFDKSRSIGGFKKWNYVTVNDEDDLRQYLYDHGPVSVGVAANDAWKAYSSGIFTASCGVSNNHAVLLIGWGEYNDIPYWIIKNSWGADWGMDGYIHLPRGQNKCGILESMTQIQM